MVPLPILRPFLYRRQSILAPDLLIIIMLLLVISISVIIPRPIAGSIIIAQVIRLICDLSGPLVLLILIMLLQLLL